MTDQAYTNQELAPEIALCSVCHKNKAQGQFKGLCRKCYNARPKRKKKGEIVIPANLAARLASAKSSEDWQKLAVDLAPTLQSIADGTTKATAAQVAILKDIYNRAYGRPAATQLEKPAAAGIVVLPTLGIGEAMKVCPRCGYDITQEPKKEELIG